MMVTWFASYANLIMSCWACVSCMCMHGAHAINKMGILKYSNGLMGTPANLNLMKLTASNFFAQTTQNANENKPNMVDTINIKTQVSRLLRYYSPAPRKIARSDWATQNITHNMTSSIKQPYGVHSH